MSATQEMLLGATALERDLDLEIERWVREIETREPQAYLGTYEFCICICMPCFDPAALWHLLTVERQVIAR